VPITTQLYFKAETGMHVSEMILSWLIAGYCLLFHSHIHCFIIIATSAPNLRTSMLWSFSVSGLMHF